MQNAQYYVPSRMEAVEGTTFEAVEAAADANDPRDHFYKGSDGRIYSRSRYGYTMLDYQPNPGVREQWRSLAGISDVAHENDVAKRSSSWSSEQFDRDVRKLHIEAGRLGFECIPKLAVNTDTFRRMFDENGVPTGFVKNDRTGTMIREDVGTELPPIDIPEPINAQSGFKTERVQIIERFDHRSALQRRPWWKKLLALRVRFSARVVDLDDDGGF